MAARDLSISDPLTLAIIASSNAPLVLLAGDLSVVAASASFCQVFKIDPATVNGRMFFDLGAGEWSVPQLRALLTATAGGDAEVAAYEMDLKPKGQDVRRLVIHARKLEYGANEDVRVLLTAADVTDARLAEKVKDDLLREKAILLQEVQHRVANSLQIIASVLLLNARKVQSDETREHMRDAHQRVMSVAALQKQLAASTLGDVILRPYFTQLCNSIGASMIRDHNQLTLTVTADDSAAPADTSVSLGLIVTELVINALKHAFPDGRHGSIVVGYHSSGQNWTLSVTDDGTGMPKGPNAAKAGLGTTIVEALAKQLHARVQATDANPGTVVSVIHSHLSVVETDAAEQAV